MGWACTTSSSCGVSLFCPGTNECVRDTPRFTTDAFIASAKSSSALKWKKFRLSTEHLKLTLTKLKLQNQLSFTSSVLTFSSLLNLKFLTRPLLPKEPLLASFPLSLGKTRDRLEIENYPAMPCHPWTALQNWFYRTTYIWPCWPIKLQYINYISISHSLKTKYLLFHLPFIWYVHQVQTIHLDNSICYLRRHKFSSAIFPFKKKAWPRQHIRKKRKNKLDQIDQY